MSVTGPIGICCVGGGNWGRNQIRTFAGLAGCQLKYIVDAIPSVAEKLQRSYPSVRVTGDLEEALDDLTVRGVVIATPASTHFPIARRALQTGRDVLIEKPMVLDTAHGEELLDLAAETGAVVQVGHVLLYHPAVAYLKGIVERGELGTLHYLYSQRLNLGTIRTDENALWSLAPHDVSLANYLLGSEPVSVSAEGGCYVQRSIEDVAFLHLEYPGNRLVHIHVSWLDPHKTRRITLVGSDRMAVFDDMEPAEKIRIYNKWARNSSPDPLRASPGVHNGDVLIPWVANDEPLRLQAEHFLQCIETRATPRVSGADGLAVVKILNEADRSLREAQLARPHGPSLGAMRIRRESSN